MNELSKSTPMTQDNDSSLWYYLQENQPVGPLPLSSVKALLRAGQLRPDSLIVPEGSEDWQAIADVLGPLAVPSVPPALPSQSQPQSLPAEPEKWYERKRVVLASLFFCFPAGLLFLWNSRRFSLPLKIGLTVPVVMVAAAFLLDHGEAIERGLPASQPLYPRQRHAPSNPQFPRLTQYVITTSSSSTSRLMLLSKD